MEPNLKPNEREASLPCVDQVMDSGMATEESIHVMSNMQVKG